MRYECVVAAAMLGAALQGPAGAAELLTGSVRLSDGEKATFSIHGQDRRNVNGGRLVLGDRTFDIDRVSRHNLIGGARDLPQGGREYVVFSSSFSDQTAVGEPWVAASRAVGCDEDYNSFIAIYRLDAGSIERLGRRTPYGVLTDDLAASDDSSVYCFMSAKGGGDASP